MDDSELTFEQGYVCAVATLIRQHGAATMARDLMGCMPNVDWSKIDPTDREVMDQHGFIRPACDCTNGVIRSIGRDNDGIVEDCPRCRG